MSQRAVCLPALLWWIETLHHYFSNRVLWNPTLMKCEWVLNWDTYSGHINIGYTELKKDDCEVLRIFNKEISLWIIKQGSPTYMAREDFVLRIQVEEFKFRSTSFMLISAAPARNIPALTVLKRKFKANSYLLPLWHVLFHIPEQGDWPADARGAPEGHQWALHSKSCSILLPCENGPPFFSAQGWREANQKSGRTLSIFYYVPKRQNPSFSFCTSGVGPWACLLCKISSCGNVKHEQLTEHQSRRHSVGVEEHEHKAPEEGVWVWNQVEQAKVEACSLLTVGT